MQHKSRLAAFFDVDNTLLNLKSMFAFQAYFYANASSHTGVFANMPDFVADLRNGKAGEDRSALNRRFYASFRGRRVDDVSQLAEQWFASAYAQHGDSLWIGPSLELAAQLRHEGFLLVAVSGSSYEILRPLLRHLAFDACLATTLASEAGVYTGHIVPPQVIGEGKGEAMRRFAHARGIDLRRCVACGDHMSDLPMLEATGMQFVVRGDPMLETVARMRGWPLLDTVPPLPQDAFVHV